MPSLKSFVKGLAAGAVLGAVAAMATTVEDKDEKLASLQKAAQRIKAKVAKDAQQVGKLSKTAYHRIVDATVEEYRSLKHLTDDELVELKRDLKDSWVEVERMVKNKPKTKKK